MPTYDYKCEKCEKTFEYFQSMSDEPLKICKECQGPLKRLIGGGLGLIFKGSGFYVTDNKSKDNKTSPAKTANKDSSPAKKTETKKQPVKTT